MVWPSPGGRSGTGASEPSMTSPAARSRSEKPGGGNGTCAGTGSAAGGGASGAAAGPASGASCAGRVVAQAASAIRGSGRSLRIGRNLAAAAPRTKAPRADRPSGYLAVDRAERAAVGGNSQVALLPGVLHGVAAARGPTVQAA